MTKDGIATAFMVLLVIGSALTVAAAAALAAEVARAWRRADDDRP